MVEGEMGGRKKLRELRGSYEFLNSYESFHVTTAVNAGRPSKTCSEDSNGHALTPTAILHSPLPLSPRFTSSGLLHTHRGIYDLEGRCNFRSFSKKKVL
jgi:hypothetical protein